MSNKTSYISGVAIATLALAASAPAQSTGKLSPRELFYRPVAAQTAPAATSGKKPAAKSAGQTQVAKSSGSSQTTNPSTEPAEATPVVLASGGRPQGAAPALRPLGLRYSLLRVTDSGTEEVGPDTTFRSGDKIRVSFESNDPGFLYIVMRGTSGTWKRLFPDQEINGGDNRVVPGRAYMIPPAPSRFTFDEQAGEEKLFIVLSRKPEPSLESLIYSLTGAQQSAPAAAPEPGQPVPLRKLVAANYTRIDDILVGRLRNQVMARDLVFEKVDDNTPGERKEKAVYVVNTNASSDARLVVDLKLQHR